MDQQYSRPATVLTRTRARVLPLQELEHHRRRELPVPAEPLSPVMKLAAGGPACGCGVSVGQRRGRRRCPAGPGSCLLGEYVLATPPRAHLLRSVIDTCATAVLVGGPSSKALLDDRG